MTDTVAVTDTGAVVVGIAVVYFRGQGVTTYVDVPKRLTERYQIESAVRDGIFRTYGKHWETATYRVEDTRGTVYNG